MDSLTVDAGSGRESAAGTLGFPGVRASQRNADLAVSPRRPPDEL